MSAFPRGARRQAEAAERHRAWLAADRLTTPVRRAVIPPPSASWLSTTEPERAARVRAEEALDAWPEDPVYARARYTVGAVAVPEEVRLREFREVAAERGVETLLPSRPWSPGEVEAHARRLAARKVEAARSPRRDWTPEEDAA